MTGDRKAPIGAARALTARNLSLALIAALAAIPLGASLAQTQVADTDQASSRVQFAEHFREVIEPLGPDYDNAELNIPPDAVDLDSFEPPIEVPPPPPPEPRTGSVIRSLGTGVASYYGRRFHGRLTANGERFNMNAMTAAHKTLPFGTRVRVTNPRNGRSVTVRINDRGPFIRGREIDLSRGAAQRIGMIASGHARVRLDIVSR